MTVESLAPLELGKASMREWVAVTEKSFAPPELGKASVRERQPCNDSRESRPTGARQCFYE